MRIRLAIGALALALAGCGTDTAGSDPAFNGTDVMFLQMMAPHHEQGLELVKLAQERATNPDLKTLAAAIEVTQASEMQTMVGWLTAWGQPATVDPAAHAAHGGMPGTTTEDLERLAQGPPAEFGRGLLNMLIAHQDDAVQIARMETAGINTEAKSLAQRIELSRKAQIHMMLAMVERDS